MTPCEEAIALLQVECDVFGQGTPDQPKEGTRDFYTLRAKIIGLAFLKRLQADGVAGTPQMLEKFYRAFLREVKTEVVVPVKEVPVGPTPVS